MIKCIKSTNINDLNVEWRNVVRKTKQRLPEVYPDPKIINIETVRDGLVYVLKLWYEDGIG